MTLAPTQQLLFNALSDAAARGVPCPRNDELASLIGTHCGPTVVRVMKRLEEEGMIRVNRFGQGREIQIVATGDVTAYSGPREPHWRLRDLPLHDFGRTAHQMAAAAPLTPAAPVAPARINRDPCPRCGVRGDIGCAHQGHS